MIWNDHQSGWSSTQSCHGVRLNYTAARQLKLVETRRNSCGRNQSTWQCVCRYRLADYCYYYYY